MPQQLEGQRAKGTAELLKARFGLTRTEVRVAVLVSDGLSYAEIASVLGISTHTVHTHIKEIHRKLQVHTNPRAAARIRELEEEM